jgi:hypothetical protein
MENSSVPTEPLPQQQVSAFVWLGNESAYIDEIGISACGPVVIGRYGGHSRAGARKNEDGALVWAAADSSWEFAMLVDAHFTSESAELLLYTVNRERKALVSCLAQSLEAAFPALENYLVSVFRSTWFREQCRRVKGEASCFFTARKGDYLWWLSIGDCVGYVLDPQLVPLGQFALNQRNYYEWVGHINTFDQPVPTYTRGVCNLSDGNSLIVMTTDGLLEFGSRPFENPMHLYRVFLPAFQGSTETMAFCVETALSQVHGAQGRDSATVIAWRYTTTDR